MRRLPCQTSLIGSFGTRLFRTIGQDDETLSREEAQRKGQMPKAAAPA